tara:strand:- start:36 stop:701 length:666 start_codon:yes stop_codon:yes gene_type:complete
MSCSDCDDNKIPLALAKGSDGLSTYVAFASNAAGDDFSYTAGSTLPFISFVTKLGSVLQADFVTWVDHFGDDGTNGISITGVAIDGNDDLIITLSDSSTINAGSISSCCDLTWVTLILTNGWVKKVSNKAETKPEYAIDGMGFIHFRGTITDTAATATDFTSIVFTGVSQTTYSSISEESVASVHSRFLIDYDRANVSIDNYGNGTSDNWVLDSVPPIFLR